MDCTFRKEIKDECSREASGPNKSKAQPGVVVHSQHRRWQEQPLPCCMLSTWGAKQIFFYVRHHKLLSRTLAKKKLLSRKKLVISLCQKLAFSFYVMVDKIGNFLFMSVEMRIRFYARAPRCFLARNVIAQ